jgi:hypothetical protein
MNRREVMKWTGAASLLVSAGIPLSAAPVYKRIEISRDGSSFSEQEFETLIAGDRFRVISPPESVNGTVYICQSGAEPMDGEPGNWGVQCGRAELPA